MADDSGKTEKPTAKRLREARKEGQFARTQDAATWAGIAAGAALLPHTATTLGDDVRTLLAALPAVAQDPQPARLLEIIGQLPAMTLWAALPLALAAVGASVAATASQGVHPSGKALRFKGKRLNPAPGIKRMFGPKAAWEGLKALLKVIVIGAVVAVLATSVVPDPVLHAAGLTSVLTRTRSAVESLLYTAAVTGLLMALADYAYQRRTVMKQLRMSPREIKDENRQAEGDPLIKGAIRSRQMAMSRNRMLSAVIDANVVLVNPTHYAVALSYDPLKGAPRVVAKGADALALKIRKVAQENRVPVVEDKPLARTLYRVCELNDEIPTELFMAVARILAFVMQAGRPQRDAAVRRPQRESVLPALPSKAMLRQRRSREARDARKAMRT